MTNLTHKLQSEITDLLETQTSFSTDELVKKQIKLSEHLAKGKQ